jgi:hypothetical protein
MEQGSVSLYHDPNAPRPGRLAGVTWHYGLLFFLFFALLASILGVTAATLYKLDNWRGRNDGRDDHHNHDTCGQEGLEALTKALKDPYAPVDALVQGTDPGLLTSFPSRPSDDLVRFCNGYCGADKVLDPDISYLTLGDVGFYNFGQFPKSAKYLKYSNVQAVIFNNASTTICTYGETSAQVDSFPAVIVLFEGNPWKKVRPFACYSSYGVRSYGVDVTGAYVPPEIPAPPGKKKGGNDPAGNGYVKVLNAQISWLAVNNETIEEKNHHGEGENGGDEGGHDGDNWKRNSGSDENHGHDEHHGSEGVNVPFVYKGGQRKAFNVNHRTSLSVDVEPLCAYLESSQGYSSVPVSDGEHFRVLREFYEGIDGHVVDGNEGGGKRRRVRNLAPSDKEISLFASPETTDILKASQAARKGARQARRVPVIPASAHAHAHAGKPGAAAPAAHGHAGTGGNGKAGDHAAHIHTGPHTGPAKVGGKRSHA